MIADVYIYGVKYNFPGKTTPAASHHAQFAKPPLYLLPHIQLTGYISSTDMTNDETRPLLEERLDQIAPSPKPSAIKRTPLPWRQLSILFLIRVR